NPDVAEVAEGHPAAIGGDIGCARAADRLLGLRRGRQKQECCQGEMRSAGTQHCGHPRLLTKWGGSVGRVSVATWVPLPRRRSKFRHSTHCLHATFQITDLPQEMQMQEGFGQAASYREDTENRARPAKCRPNPG